MKILVITRNNWSDANNVGNTLSNFFSYFKEEKKVEFANIACSIDKPQNSICKKYFLLSEKQLIKALLHRKNNNGKTDVAVEKAAQTAYEESSIKKFFRAHPLTISKLIREAVWCIGNWKCLDLEKFIVNFNPDIIVMPVYGTWYMHKIYRYVLNVSGAKSILFFWDDYTTLHQLSFSPLFWINRLIARGEIKKSQKITDKCYCISEKMKAEYEKIYSVNMDILTKGYDFGVKPEYKFNSKDAIKCIFIGNLGLERWKSLSKLAEEIQKINVSNKKTIFELNIYTLSTRTKKMQKGLNIIGCSKMMEYLPADQVSSVLESADILVHVEPMSLKQSLKYRLSFSTKIVDYFKAGRCILALGNDTATMEYLKKNDAALIVSNHKELVATLNYIYKNPKVLRKYVDNSWNCGVKNHNKSKVQVGLYDTLCELCNK